MRKSNILLLIITIVLAPLIFSRCANVSRAPSGGPKDSIPPVIVKTIPENGAINFTGKKVEIFLDEYPKLKDPQKQLTVSPPLKTPPTYRSKGKGVFVEFRDTLRTNTTYHIDFGSSITDNTEGNAIEQYSLSFSTGDSITIGRIKGRVLDAFSLEPVENVKVLLYENNIDSLPLTTLSDGLAKASKRGYFIADMLKEQQYMVIAVEDKNNSNLYEPGDEKVGFIDFLPQALNAKSDSTTILTYEKDTISTFPDLFTIKLFSENTKKQFLDSHTQPEERKVVLCFSQRNPTIQSLSFEGIDSLDIIAERTFWGDTTTYWLKSDTIPHELKASITYLRPDSLDNIVPFTAELKFPERKPKKEKDDRKNKDQKEEKPKLNIAINTNKDLITEKGIELKMPAPLTTLDTTKVSLYKFRDKRDTLKTKIPLVFSKDTTGLCYYNIQAKWETDEAYVLEILPLAFTDIYKLQNDTIVQRIETPNENKFSVLAFDFSNVDKPYIIQVLKDKNIVQEKYISAGGKLKFSFLTPGDYRVRVIEDLNGNQRWDTGSYLEKKQPEQVIFLKSTNDTAIFSLRPNWENEFTVDLGVLFNSLPLTLE